VSYDRARFIIGEMKAPIRDAKAARALYDDIFEPMGGRYCGWIAHPYAIAPNPAHFYIFDDPTPTYLAELLRIIRDERVKGFLKRDRWSEGEIDYCIEQIMADIAQAMVTNLTEPPVDSHSFARCWEGIKVLEAIALLEKLA
jgi:hypothetical protein